MLFSPVTDTVYSTNLHDLNISKSIYSLKYEPTPKFLSWNPRERRLLYVALYRMNIQYNIKKHPHHHKTNPFLKSQHVLTMQSIHKYNIQLYKDQFHNDASRVLWFNSVFRKYAQRVHGLVFLFLCLFVCFLPSFFPHWIFTQCFKIPSFQNSLNREYPALFADVGDTCSIKRVIILNW